jgi:hypothetical protein
MEELAKTEAELQHQQEKYDVQQKRIQLLRK